MAKRAKKRNRRRAKRQRDPTLPTVRTPLEKCMVDYSKAVLNPFDASPVCLPHSPAHPSGKYKVFARGTAACGTAGFGYVALRPWAAMINNHVATAEPVIYSGAAYAAQVVETDTTAVGVFETNTNSPFAGTSVGFGSGKIQSRVVAAGLRIRYIGTELDRSGRLIAFTHPNSDGLDTYTVGDLLAHPHTESVGNRKQWVATTYTPVLPDQFAYSDNILTWTNGNNTVATEFSMAVVLDKAEASAPFEWEAYVLFESIGTIIRNPSPNHADDGLYSRLIEGLQGLATSTIDYTTKLTGKALTNTATRFVSAAAEAGIVFATRRYLTPRGVPPQSVQALRIGL